MVKSIKWIQHTKIIEANRNGDKDWKALYELMSNAAYGKTIENWEIESM